MPLLSQHTSNKKAKLLQRIGHFLKRETVIVRSVQWCVVFIYFALLFYPLVSILLGKGENKAWAFTQLIFWEIGWSLIILSVIIFGRVWCGFFCPDGTLTETISRYGQNRYIPRWIRRKNWSLLTLVITILLGQTVSVYDNYIGTLLVLGLPTLGAIICGYLYAEGRRIWCMYLCPVNALFSTFAKISPFYFKVQTKKWENLSASPPRLNCPTLIDVKRMDSMSACHSCCRCVGYLNAVELDVRSSEKEILFSKNNDKTQKQDANILLFGILGICNLALLWKKHKAFIWLRDTIKPLLSQLNNYDIPTWSLPNNTEHIHTLFDATAILIYIILGSVIIYLSFRFSIWLALKIAKNTMLTWQKLSLAFIPITSASILFGLLERNISHLQILNISTDWFACIHTAVLVGSCLYSLLIATKLLNTESKAVKIISAFILMIPCWSIIAISSEFFI